MEMGQPFVVQVDNLKTTWSPYKENRGVQAVLEEEGP